MNPQADVPEPNAADQFHELGDRANAESIAEALDLLHDAQELAAEFGHDSWEFAIELAALREVGLTLTDCRWLVSNRLAEHALETTLAGSTNRSFQPSNNLGFSQHTCFVLSDVGREWVAKGITSSAATGRESDDVTKPAPHWDGDRHELLVGGMVVKRFRLPAPNQEAVLHAFQEENWPTCIDDPLRPRPGADAKRRLHDTINSLNRNQKQKLLRFYGDGTGQRVCWEAVTTGAKPAK